MLLLSVFPLDSGSASKNWGGQHGLKHQTSKINVFFSGILDILRSLKVQVFLSFFRPKPSRRHWGAVNMLTVQQGVLPCQLAAPVRFPVQFLPTKLWVLAPKGHQHRGNAVFFTTINGNDFKGYTYIMCIYIYTCIHNYHYTYNS